MTFNDGRWNATKPSGNEEVFIHKAIHLKHYNGNHYAVFPMLIIEIRRTFVQGHMGMQCQVR